MPLVTLALALAGCGGSTPTAPPSSPLPPPPSLVGFRIEPPEVTLVAGGSLQFRALDPSDQAVAVQWGLESPAFGSITPAGLLTTCFVGGTTHVTARAQADTTQAARARVDLIVPAIALVSVQAIRYAPTQAPARLDSLAGGMEVDVAVPAGRLRCFEILAVRLDLLTGEVATPLGAVALSPAPSTDFVQTFPWDAGAVVNGTYALRAVITVAGSGERPSTSVPIRIRNP